MSMSEAMRQMPAGAGRAGVARGEAVGQLASDEAEGPRREATGMGSALLQAALTRDNLQCALKRVRANKGAAGVDGLDIDQSVAHLVTANSRRWWRNSAKLLNSVLNIAWFDRLGLPRLS
jgi:RNA-directed DNA polymerase